MALFLRRGVAEAVTVPQQAQPGFLEIERLCHNEPDRAGSADRHPHDPRSATPERSNLAFGRAPN